MNASKQMRGDFHVEELHQQSVEWLDEISFIKEELVFLKSLVTKLAIFPQVNLLNLTRS